MRYCTGNIIGGIDWQLLDYCSICVFKEKGEKENKTKSVFIISSCPLQRQNLVMEDMLYLVLSLYIFDARLVIVTMNVRTKFLAQT